MIRRQVEGVEFFAYMSKLLKENIWDKAMKAVNDEDYTKFKEMCVEAGIPKDVTDVCDDMHIVIYAMLRAGLEAYPTMYVWP